MYGSTLTSHPRKEPLSPRQCILDPPAKQKGDCGKNPTHIRADHSQQSKEETSPVDGDPESLFHVVLLSWDLLPERFLHPALVRPPYAS